MVVPAFGFSAGDFIAAIGLIHTVTKALQEIDGATRRYQQGIIELQLLENVLSRLQAIDRTGRPSDTIDKLAFCAHACYIPLNDFLSSIRKLEPQLGPTSGRGHSNPVHHVKRAARKTQWAVQLESELAKLKAKIGPILHLLGILLQLHGVEKQDHVIRDAQAGLQAASHLTDSVRQLRGFVASELATRDQVAAMEVSVNRMGSQVLKSHATAHSAQQTTSKTISDKIDIQEKLLRQLLRQCKHESTVPHSRTALPDDALLDHSSSTPRPVSRAVQSLSNLQDTWSMFLEALAKATMELLLVLTMMLPAVQRFLRALTTMARAPSLLLEDNVHLEDALGRVMSLPYQHFRFWPVVEARLRCDFTGCPGEHKIERGEFLIINLMAGGNRVLTKSTWEKGVYPGARLAMSMLIRGDRQVRQRSCPRCIRTAPSSPREGWVQCQGCKREQRVLIRRRANKVRSQSAKRGDVERSDLDRNDVMHLVDFVSEMENEDDISAPGEIDYYRRVHMIGLHMPGRKTVLDQYVAHLRQNFSRMLRSVESDISKKLQHSIAKDPLNNIDGAPGRRVKAENATPEPQGPRRPQTRPVPLGARWTRIDRKLVNPEALEEAKERFKVIVSRVLTKDELRRLAIRTRQIRNRRALVESRAADQRTTRTLLDPVDSLAYIVNTYGSDKSGRPESRTSANEKHPVRWDETLDDI